MEKGVDEVQESSHTESEHPTALKFASLVLARLRVRRLSPSSRLVEVGLGKGHDGVTEEAAANPRQLGEDKWQSTFQKSCLYKTHSNTCHLGESHVECCSELDLVSRTSLLSSH
jgi:hypothetical protein